MPGGINFDEMKRQQEYMTMRAEQNLSKEHKMADPIKMRGRKDRKQALKAAAIFLGLILVLILLIRGGVL